MSIVLDIETLPGDLGRMDEDIQDIVDSGQVKCSLKKSDLVEALGDPKLKYKTLDELVPMWLADPENARSAAMETYRARALDGGKGKVLCFAVEIDGGVISFLDKDEKNVLNYLAEIVRNSCGRKDGAINQPFFIAHNAEFDLGFLYRRFVINRINPGFKLPFYGWHAKDYFCTMQAWAGRGNRISQDSLCTMLGIEGKPDGIDGSKVFDYAMEGKYNAILEYCADDTKKCAEIYRRLTFSA